MMDARTQSHGHDCHLAVVCHRGFSQPLGALFVLSYSHSSCRAWNVLSRLALVCSAKHNDCCTKAVKGAKDLQAFALLASRQTRVKKQRQTQLSSDPVQHTEGLSERPGRRCCKCCKSTALNLGARAVALTTNGNDARQGQVRQAGRFAKN